MLFDNNFSDELFLDNIKLLEDQMEKQEFRYKKSISSESFIFLLIFFIIFGYIGSIMGVINMVNTILNTGFFLLTEVCWYIMAISVIAGGLSELFSEFGIIELLNMLLYRFMKPLYNLPGAAALGVVSCYFSDNPAILTLADNRNFRSHFKKFQLPALTNLGTSFGMGLIVTTTMMSMNVDGAVMGALVGNIGAFIGSIVSVRIMIGFTKKYYGSSFNENLITNAQSESTSPGTRIIRNGTAFERFINSLLSGGETGVNMGMQIIPGVILICTLVLLLTNGTSELGTYTGQINEGVPILPFIGEKLSFIIKPLFGFSSNEAIAVPVTALGSAGAAIGLVPELVQKGLVSGNDIAVFTALCMCWSGYLSTHIAMMDALGCSDLSGKAITSHTIGGLVAGISSNLIYSIFL